MTKIKRKEGKEQIIRKKERPKKKTPSKHQISQDGKEKLKTKKYVVEQSKLAKIGSALYHQPVSY